jgi:imidazolonepropionase-like amidohydrolase
MRLSLVIGLTVVAASLSAQSTAPLTAIRFGTLVDGTGRVLRDAVVVVSSDTIVSVGTGSSAVPRGARVIDLRRYTGIPGMIDAHTHISY